MLYRLRTSLIILAMLLCGHHGHARYVDISIAEQVERSDVGIVGELIETRRTGGYGQEFVRGYLRVDKVLYGDTLGKAQIPIKWVVNRTVTGGGDLARSQGKRIWFFNLTGGEIIYPDPRCSDEVDKEAAVLKAIENPLRANIAPTPKDQFPKIRLSYRNLTSAPMELPAFGLVNGKLQFPADTTFTVARSRTTLDKYLLPTAPGKVEFTSPTSMQTVLPGQSYNVTFPVQQIFSGVELMDRFYWGIPEVGSTHPLWIEDPNFDPGWAVKDDYFKVPIWIKVIPLLRNSPTREIIIAAVLLPPIIFYYILSRRRKTKAGI